MGRIGLPERSASGDFRRLREETACETCRRRRRDRGCVSVRDEVSSLQIYKLSKKLALTLDRCAYVTGQTIQVDGGYSLV